MDWPPETLIETLPFWAGGATEGGGVGAGGAGAGQLRLGGCGQAQEGDGATVESVSWRLMREKLY